MSKKECQSSQARFLKARKSTKRGKMTRISHKTWGGRGNRSLLAYTQETQ